MLLLFFFFIGRSLDKEDNGNTLMGICWCASDNTAIYALCLFPFRSPQDYGTLLCWGSNELGRQVDPCIFNILPAGNEPSST